jgi:hypothetical protein
LERRSSRGPQPIGDILRQFLKDSGLRRTSGDERVLSAWSQAAGDVWKTRAAPVLLRAGQLTVEVASAPYLAELRGFHGEGIRRRANAILGEERIRKVVFKLRS